MRLLASALLALGLAAPALAQPQVPVGTPAAPTVPTNAPRASTSDPRASLRAGWMDAEARAWNLEHVANIPRTGPFVNPDDPGDFGRANTDLAFQGDKMFVGNYNGVQIYSLADPARPRLVSQIVCAGGQGDVSVHGNLLFMSVEETRGRLDCGDQGVPEPVSAERLVGIRVFDISNLDRPRQVATVQTCRGSHTHTLVPDPRDPQNLYVYVSGISGVRPGDELAGCAGGNPAENADGSSYFRIEVVKVPLAAPQMARIVNSARFLLGLPAPPAHAATQLTPEQRAAAEARVAEARAQGRFAVVMGGEVVDVPEEAVGQILGQIVQQRGGTGAPTRADSLALHEMLPRLVAAQESRGNRTGPTSCHDITVYPEKGLAGGACEGYGILLDIRNPEDPKRLDTAGDANFAYWHSATFNNDATSVVFTDEWGGGMGARCRASDRMNWGANALFRIENGRALRQTSYYKLPAAQGETENCVAHNGSLVPIPGRDVMVQAWYQGGLSIFDFTDPAAPREIAYFDRGPMSAENLMLGGYWSVYYYNGYIYGSEIGRGVDVFRLAPSEHLSASEIAAAATVRERVMNPQMQTTVRWAPSVTLARAYLDQAQRADALTGAQATGVRTALDAAGRARTAAQKRTAATALTTQARRIGSTDAAARRLAETLVTVASSMR